MKNAALIFQMGGWEKGFRGKNKWKSHKAGICLASEKQQSPVGAME